MAAWRMKTRRELGLDTSRPIIATGHQTLLWHPGILVKYLAADAVARAEDFATANLIVDQHADAADGGELFLRFEQARTRPDFHAIGERDAAIAFEVVGGDQHARHTLREQRAHYLGDADAARCFLAPGHGDRAIPQQFEGDPAARGDARSDRE